MCFCIVNTVAAQEAAKPAAKPADQNVPVLITNKQIGELSTEQIKSFYTLQRKLLPNGNTVKPTMLPLSHEHTVRFTQSLFGFYPYQLSRIWDRRIFTGKAQTPIEFETPQALLRFVSETDNAVGYLYVAQGDLAKLKEAVNVLVINL